MPRNPRTTAAGIRRVVDEIHRRMPSTRVLLLAIFPRVAFESRRSPLAGEHVQRDISVTEKFIS